MAFDPNALATFIINEVGETTFESYPGAFKVRQLLNHAQQLERDRLRRDLLGGSAQTMATPRAADQAAIFAELMIRIVEAPKWWTESGNGVGLFDDNVVKKVYDLSIKAEDDFKDEIRKRAAEAKKDLEKVSSK
jgi:hypothetical protein